MKFLKGDFVKSIIILEMSAIKIFEPSFLIVARHAPMSEDGTNVILVFIVARRNGKNRSGFRMTKVYGIG